MITKIMVTLMIVASMIGSPSGTYVYKNSDDHYNSAEMKIMKYNENEYILHEQIGEEDIRNMASYTTGEFGKMDIYLDSDANGALSVIIYDIWGNYR